MVFPMIKFSVSNYRQSDIKEHISTRLFNFSQVTYLESHNLSILSSQKAFTMESRLLLGDVKCIPKWKAYKTLHDTGTL